MSRLYIAKFSPDQPVTAPRRPERGGVPLRPGCVGGGFHNMH
jgi:hypothetical protein